MAHGRRCCGEEIVCEGGSGRPVSLRDVHPFSREHYDQPEHSPSAGPARGLHLCWHEPAPGTGCPYRPALHQLRVELDSAHSLTEVDAIAAGWEVSGPRAVNRLASAYIELQRGVLANDRLVLDLRLGPLRPGGPVHPDWPYARLGLAEAALEIYSRRYPMPASYDDVAGGTHYDGYAIQMKRTLRSEPTFQPAINWLAVTMSEEGDRDQPGEILEALQYIADSTNSTDPRVQLILARAERLHGDAAQSVPRLNAYLREGGDRGVAELELARSFAWLGELEKAAAEYMTGAAVQTEEARAIYRLDTSPGLRPRASWHTSTACRPIQSPRSSDVSGTSAMSRSSVPKGAGCRNICGARCT